jgi:hypothetical protein
MLGKRLNSKHQASTVYQDNVVPLFPPQSLSGSLLYDDQILVPEPVGWVVQLADRFDELTSLRRGWDGYAGIPVSFSCAQFAANLLDRLFDAEVGAPQLVPGSDGTIQIEWHENNFDIEVDILAPYHVVAFRYDLLADQEIEIELDTDFTALAGWISELKVDRSEMNCSGV